MSVCLSHASLLCALGLEGGAVRIFKPQGRAYYHVFFRYKGKQVNRSTGTLVYAEAQEHAARIFAEVVQGPQSIKQNTVLERLEIKIESFLASPSVSGSVASRPTQNHHRPDYLSPVPACLGDAVTDFLKEREKGDYSRVAEEQLARRLRSFVKHANAYTPLGMLTPDLVSSWSSVKNDLDSVRQFARWCAAPRRKWLDADLVSALPVAAKKKTKVSYNDLLPAEILEKMLRHLEEKAPQYILFYVICALSGVRGNKEKNKGEGDAGEVVRLLASVRKNGWGMHLKDNGLWVIETKTGNPRLAYTPEALRAWIEKYPASIETPTQAWHREHLSRIFSLPKNTLRKTCAASYCSLVGPALAPLLFGNSDGMLRRYYVPGLIPTPQAKAWFDIWPTGHAPAAAVAA